MNYNENIAQVLNSTSQSAPKMTEALSILGNGRMGDGILRLVDWAREDNKTYLLAQGRFQGAAVTGIIASVSFATLSFFMHRQFRKEHERTQNAMFDLLDDLAAMKADLTAAQSTSGPQNDLDEHSPEQEKEDS